MHKKLRQQQMIVPGNVEPEGNYFIIFKLNLTFLITFKMCLFAISKQCLGWQGILKNKKATMVSCMQSFNSTLL